MQRQGTVGEPVLSAQQRRPESTAGSASSASARRVGSRMTYSRVIGALLLAAFVLYAGGLGLATSVVGAGNSLSTISARQDSLVIGALLMLLNCVVVLSIGVLIFPILDNHSRRTAVAYLGSRTGEAVFLALGVLALLMTIPLAQQTADAGTAETDLGQRSGVARRAVEQHGLPDRRDIARSRQHILLLAAVPDPVDPPVPGGLGLDWLRDLPRGGGRGNLRDPHWRHALDPRWTI